MQQLGPGLSVDQKAFVFETTVQTSSSMALCAMRLENYQDAVGYATKASDIVTALEAQIGDNAQVVEAALQRRPDVLDEVDAMHKFWSMSSVFLAGKEELKRKNYEAAVKDFSEALLIIGGDPALVTEEGEVRALLEQTKSSMPIVQQEDNQLTADAFGDDQNLDVSPGFQIPLSAPDLYQDDSTPVAQTDAEPGINVVVNMDIERDDNAPGQQTSILDTRGSGGGGPVILPVQVGELGVDKKPDAGSSAVDSVNFTVESSENNKSPPAPPSQENGVEDRVVFGDISGKLTVDLGDEGKKQGGLSDTNASNTDFEVHVQIDSQPDSSRPAVVDQTNDQSADESSVNIVLKVESRGSQNAPLAQGVQAGVVSSDVLGRFKRSSSGSATTNSKPRLSFNSVASDTSAQSGPVGKTAMIRKAAPLRDDGHPFVRKQQPALASPAPSSSSAPASDAKPADQQNPLKLVKPIYRILEEQTSAAGESSREKQEQQGQGQPRSMDGNDGGSGGGGGGGWFDWLPLVGGSSSSPSVAPSPSM